MKPPLAYYGGKTTIADRIVALLPQHEHYVEPYAGSLAVLFAKPAAAMETVNDLDGDLMTWWRILRDRPDELIRLCALTPHSRGELEACRKPADDELEQARRVWVRITQGRTGTLRKTGWRFFVDPKGSSAGMPTYLAGYVDRMAAAVERLANVSLEARPGLEVVNAYGRHATSLLYVDPPYLGTARVGGRNYQVEMSGEAEHQELAEALHAARAAVVLSGYDSPLYRELYADWDRVSIDTHTGQTGQWSERTEVLWLNRPVVADLFTSIEAAP